MKLAFKIIAGLLALWSSLAIWNSFRVFMVTLDHVDKAHNLGVDKKTAVKNANKDLMEALKRKEIRTLADVEHIFEIRLDAYRFDFIMSFM